MNAPGSSLLLVLLLLGATARGAESQQLAMTIDASQTGAPINPFIYGQFTENANNNFYRGGLWSEVIDDRKFFHPVGAPADSTPRARQAARWQPVGGAGVVAMDSQQVWVGDHSPKITLDAVTPHGIRQAGLGVTATRYVGRIVLAADAGAEVGVSLLCGPRESDRQTVRITGIGREYAKYPLSFTCGAESRDAAIEIVATGSGAFHVGAVSLMPSDNVQGWRADMMAILKDIAPTMVRWGGNVVSNYEWRFGIGDPDRRPPFYDQAWRMAESNDVGTDEFLALNTILGSVPYITVNAGFGDAWSAAQWLEYCNGAATTPMGRLRAANGHPEPYAVKWWNIGNEMYGKWQMGTMQLSQYTIKHNLFARAMRQVDPSITIVAVGATPAEMGTTGSARFMTGKAVAEFAGPADWNFAMLTESAPFFDYLAEHLYPRGNAAFDAEKQDFVTVDEPLAWNARRLPNRVKTAVEAWQEYQKRFPKLDMKSIQIALDEYAPGRPGTRTPLFSTLSTAEALHELFRNSEWFVMAEFTHLTGLVTIDPVRANIQPVGQLFKLYRHHFGSIPVAVAGNVPQPDVKGLVGVDKPLVPSGSDTYPLDVAAALSADRKVLTVAVVNPSEAAQTIAVKFAGVTLQPQGKLYRIEAPAAGAAGQSVGIVESPVTRVPATLTLPAQSISLYELRVR
ncbi:MAG: alpha-N-arabinofuranosidase [Chloroflexi bacterium]|nr:alpha-N-arabinofuranosidase [Chloroflexota bacterium]